MSTMRLLDLKQYCEDIVVLYVEDDEDVRTSISFILESIFKNVIVAVDGKDGFEKFKQYQDNIDLVITDISMPKKNGIEMSSDIRQIDNEVIIMVISAYNDTDYFLKMISLDIDGYLIKPVEMGQFVGSLYKATQQIYYKKQNEKYKETLQIEVEKKTKELLEKYYIDDLTKLHNRYALLRDIKRYKISKLILVDINRFSVLNNLYGSNAGDTILKIITEQLHLITPKNCSLYRAYADQFVFIPNKKDCTTSHKELVEIISNSINESNFKITLDNELIDVNISVTIAVVENSTEDQLLELADFSLHYAKQTNQPFVKYSKELTVLMNNKKIIDAVKLVKNALVEDRLIPYFQPIIKNDSISYECLVRIIDTNGNIISPFMFVDEIKHTPYYTQLTQTMIDKSFEYFDGKELSFSINLSFEDISNVYIIEHIKKQLQKYKLYNYLILEILESESIDNFDIVKNFINEMKNLGVRISIDDFGSGYSNFSYLLELEPDFIKIDGSIIKHIATNNKSYIIAKTIVEFSKELGIQTIAEFIYNKDVLDVVNQLNIDGRQGYFLGEPQSDILEAS